VKQRLIIQALAEADITEVALWYEDQRRGLGAEFLADIQASLERAAANPRQCRRLRRKPEVRRILAVRFPYRIFFVLRPDAVVVFRVLHGARHEREWKGNIPPD
jgi:plasmid stabilization system protein ParE